ncbi:hypothetical protein, partial [Actinoplanes siamensis]|uniref:hypothetical protein n=1 Tax=Actinoplanes siamensis TaxID=1223317 RepID=UPI00194201F4
MGPEKGELTMRLIRPVLGMLLLTIGLPALLAGGCLWAALRHRDEGGAFSAELQRLTAPGYAIVVPDVDRLLRDDASFARIGDTELRITAATEAGPAFVGLAPSDKVTAYLSGVPYTEIRGVQVGTGELPITSVPVDGGHALPSEPGRQDFWTRTGSGSIHWTPKAMTGDYSLVVMNASGARELRLNGAVEARPGWLDPAAWALISLGTVFLMIGVVVLATPRRRREVVYVVEPSQVPDLMLAIGTPLPFRRQPALPAAPPAGSGMFGGFLPSRGKGAHRPRTLADSRPVRPPALPQFAWPPRNSVGAGGDSLAVSPISSGTAVGPSAEPNPVPGTTETPVPAASAASAGPADGDTHAGISPSGLTPVVPGALPVPSPATRPDAATGNAVSRAATPTPAPGEPLNLLNETATPPRSGRRRPPAPADLPEFHATAVGAWVAETAPERARQTEAQAAAALAEAARSRAAKLPSKDLILDAQPASPAGRTPAVGSAAESSPASEAGAGSVADALADAVALSDAAALADKAVAAADAASPHDNPATPAAVPSAAPQPADRATGGTTRRGGGWPAPAPRRVALLTGPNITDWAASGLTRTGGDRPPARPADPARTAKPAPAGDFPTENRETATAAEEKAVEAAATEKDQKRETEEPAPETEKREEPKSPIVPFPTRQPAAPSKPVPSARAAETQRPSIHEAEAADPESGQPESGQPESGQPESGQPESGQPESGQP